MMVQFSSAVLAQDAMFLLRAFTRRAKSVTKNKYKINESFQQHCIELRSIGNLINNALSDSSLKKIYWMELRSRILSEIVSMENIGLGYNFTVHVDLSLPTLNKNRFSKFGQKNGQAVLNALKIVCTQSISDDEEGKDDTKENTDSPSSTKNNQYNDISSDTEANYLVPAEPVDPQADLEFDKAETSKKEHSRNQEISDRDKRIENIKIGLNDLRAGKFSNSIPIFDSMVSALIEEHDYLERNLPNNPDKIKIHREITEIIKNLSYIMSTTIVISRDDLAASDEYISDKANFVDDFILHCEDWWTQNQKDVADMGFRIGIIGVAMSFLTLLGAPALGAFMLPTAMMGGGKAVKVIKSLSKR